MERVANYRIELVEDFVGDEPMHVELTDLGPWDKYPTITNSVEPVLVELVGGEVLGPELDRRLFYRDSDGDRDEIVHDRGTFLRFAPAREAGR